MLSVDARDPLHDVEFSDVERRRHPREPENESRSSNAAFDEFCSLLELLAEVAPTVIAQHFATGCLLRLSVGRLPDVVD